MQKCLPLLRSEMRELIAQDKLNGIKEVTLARSISANLEEISNYDIYTISTTSILHKIISYVPTTLCLGSKGSTTVCSRYDLNPWMITCSTQIYNERMNTT